jgi:hypothetical protein
LSTIARRLYELCSEGDAACAGAPEELRKIMSSGCDCSRGQTALCFHVTRERIDLRSAPANVAKAAKVVHMDDKGNEIALRERANGFTCFPGHPGVVGEPAYSANEATPQRKRDFAAHKAKPTPHRN